MEGWADSELRQCPCEATFLGQSEVSKLQPTPNTGPGYSRSFLAAHSRSISSAESTPPCAFAGLALIIIPGITLRAVRVIECPLLICIPFSDSPPVFRASEPDPPNAAAISVPPAMANPARIGCVTATMATTPLAVTETAEHENLPPRQIRLLPHPRFPVDTGGSVPNCVAHATAAGTATKPARTHRKRGEIRCLVLEK